MFGINRQVVAQNERALVYRNKVLEDFVGPGVYRYFDLMGRSQWQVYDLIDPLFEHQQMDVLLAEHAGLMARHFDVYELDANQVGLVSRNGHLVDILAPDTRTVYWKGPVHIEVSTVEIDPQAEIPSELASQLVRAREPQLISAARNTVLPVVIGSDSVGLLMVNGDLKRTLQSGVYAFWRFNHEVTVEQVETRIRAMEVSGQEILTRDRVSLRVNLSAQYRVIDPVLARGSSVNVIETLYAGLQLALRQAIGTRTLDVLLADKRELDGVITDTITEQCSTYGVQVVNVGIKDIILPGEMKDILNKVVEAEKAAQANVIRRREETAATRSLLNTAKLMDENPTLMRLKELETLEKITEKVDRLTVFGGLEGVLSDTVKINLDAR
jgi:regulator of protease activity HflC (stomatin/prohibitin superfamily)